MMEAFKVRVVKKRWKHLFKPFPCPKIETYIMTKEEAKEHHIWKWHQSRNESKSRIVMGFISKCSMKGKFLNYGVYILDIKDTDYQLLILDHELTHVFMMEQVKSNEK